MVGRGVFYSDGWVLMENLRERKVLKDVWRDGGIAGKMDGGGGGRVVTSRFAWLLHKTMGRSRSPRGLTEHYEACDASTKKRCDTDERTAPSL